jgi:DNA-binding transcriptional regulator YiaG
MKMLVTTKEQSMRTKNNTTTTIHIFRKTLKLAKSTFTMYNNITSLYEENYSEKNYSLSTFYGHMFLLELEQFID